MFFISSALIFAANKILFTEIVSGEHQLNRFINLIHLSSCEINADMIKDFHKAIEDSLIYLADCFEYIKQPQKMVDLDNALDKITQLIEKIPKNDGIYKIVTECSFVFFLEQILKELKNIKQLVAKVNSKYGSNVV